MTGLPDPSMDRWINGNGPGVVGACRFSPPKSLLLPGEIQTLFRRRAGPVQGRPAPLPPWRAGSMAALALAGMVAVLVDYSVRPWLGDYGSLLVGAVTWYVTFAGFLWVYGKVRK